MRTRLVLWAGLIIFIALLTGCSSTTLNSSSKNNQFTGKVSKIYIIGFSHKQDTRQKFEDTIAEALTKNGAAGISSYQDLPELNEINDDEIDTSVKAADADALLLTIASGRGSISGADIIPPEAYRYELRIQNQSYGTYPQPYYKRSGIIDHVPQIYKPYGFYPQSAFSDFDSFSNNPTRQVTYTPPNNYQTIIIATYLFDTQSKELIWSGEIETKDSTPTDKAITDFTNAVSGELKKQGLI